MNMKLLAAAAASTLVLAACDKGGGNTAAANTAAARTPGAGASAAAEPGVAADPNDFTTQVVATPEGGFRMGNPNAPVKLVEFGSMTCHVCRDFAKESAPALEDNYIKTGKVSYEFRNFVRDPYDIVASLLARCRGAGPFFKLTEQIYTEQDAFVARARTMTPAQIKAMDALPTSQQFVQLAGVMGLDKFVGMRGLPAAKANACLTNEAERDGLVERTQRDSKQYKIDGTPTFLINGKPVDNAIQWKTLEPQIKAALGA